MSTFTCATITFHLGKKVVCLFLDNISEFFFCFQDISCIKDLNSQYEVVTVKDIYLAYDQLKIDESSMYSCIGVAGGSGCRRDFR